MKSKTITYKMLIEAADGKFANQTNHFCTEISNYQTLLDLNADDVIAFKKVNTFVQFVFSWHYTIHNIGVSFTSYKHQLHLGPSEELMGALPILPVYPLITPEIPLGNARTLFSALIQNCFKSPKFTKDIGLQLGIIEPDATSKQIEPTPVLTAKITTGGHPILHTVKGEFTGYEVWKDVQDDKGYLKLDSSFYADYIDNSPLPAIGVGKTWKYKIIYTLKGVQCGHWSNEVTIGVFGLI